MVVNNGVMTTHVLLPKERPLTTTLSTMLSQPLCGTTQHQFRDFQIHFVKQRFGSRGRVVGLAGSTKFPCLLKKLAPEFCREKRRTGVLSEENLIARTTANPRALARKKDETLGADRAIPDRVPEHLACKGAEEFFAAACQVSADR